MKLYKNETHDEERAFYGLRDAVIEDCVIDGPADGESAFKETSGLTIQNCDLALRYPLWHTADTKIINVRMPETCRAALWYDKDITIKDSKLCGIKAVRECGNTLIESCTVDSPEFGWYCRGLTLRNCDITSEYPFLNTSDLKLENVRMTGKYSFQYVHNAVIRNAVLDTKDAFWHSRNVTVYDSLIKGEYLGWYSEGLRLVRCKITGTQPLCYAKGLVLENCETEGCDLAFENSDVKATVNGHIDSVKNPMSGFIKAGSIGEIITDVYGTETTCRIETE